MDKLFWQPVFMPYNQALAIYIQSLEGRICLLKNNLRLHDFKKPLAVFFTRRPIFGLKNFTHRLPRFIVQLLF